MSKSIKAIALDVDGTITDESRRICTTAIDTIRNVESIGIPAFIVTGNIIHYANAVSILIGASGGLVAENGGVILSESSSNTGSLEILANKEKVDNAFEALKSRIDNSLKIKMVDDSAFRLSEIAIYRTISEELIKDTISDFDIEVYDTQFAIHLTDPNVNKGSSLEIVAKENGINPKNILAIGDSENDLEFLDVAGFKVAVGNADEALKAKADYVSKKPFGYGFTEAIEKFVL